MVEGSWSWTTPLLLGLCTEDMSSDRWSTTAEKSTVSIQKPQKRNIELDGPYMIDAIFVEEVLATGQLSDFLSCLVVAETDQTTIAFCDWNAARSFHGLCNQGSGVFHKPEKPTRRSHVLFRSNWGLCWSQQRRQEDQIFICRVLATCQHVIDSMA